MPLQSRTEQLGGGLICRCDAVHPLTQDAVFLASFAAPQPQETACDLGTGKGIIPLLWRAEGFEGAITAVELMPQAAALARENFSQGALKAPILLLQEDLRRLPERFFATFDLVCMNPPFFALDSARKSPNTERAAARSEVFCTPQDVCRAAAELLKPTGRFCFCIPPARLEDYRAALAQSGLTMVRKQLQSSACGAPYLVLLEAKRSNL